MEANEGKAWGDELDQVERAARMVAREDWEKGNRDYSTAAARKVAVRVGRRLSQPEMGALQRAYCGELHLLGVGQRLASARRCPSRVSGAPCVDVVGKGCVFCGAQEGSE